MNSAYQRMVLRDEFLRGVCVGLAASLAVLVVVALGFVIGGAA